MGSEPCVRIPVSEFQWIMRAVGSAYIPLLDHCNASEQELEGSIDLDVAQQNESEMAYLTELLEGRLREVLTGEETSGAFSIAGGIDEYLGAREPFKSCPALPRIL